MKYSLTFVIATAHRLTSPCPQRSITKSHGYCVHVHSRFDHNIFLRKKWVVSVHFIYIRALDSLSLQRTANGNIGGKTEGSGPLS